MLTSGYNPPMRLLPLLFIALAGPLAAGEPPYPLWDGSESVADYAKKVNLPPTKTLDLGNHVKLELVLIPAGKFIMGTPEPEKPMETVVVGQAIMVLGLAFAIVLMNFIVHPSLSLPTRVRSVLPGWLFLAVLGMLTGK